MKEFGYWLKHIIPAVKTSEVGIEEQSLRPLPLLQSELDERARNLYPLDLSIPRAQFLQVVHSILVQNQLPKEYACLPLWQKAHELQQQILASRKTPEHIVGQPA